MRMRGFSGCGWLWCVILTVGTAGPASSEPLSTGKWLVDLGRDYPLTPQANLSDFDAEIALLFMEAAARVEPDLAEAYRWQVDLLRVLGREEQALKALRRYVAREPDDVPAQMGLAVMELDRLQTAEERRDFCLDRLQREGLAPEIAAELHRVLANFYWNRGDEAKALQEAREAVRLDGNNLAARRVLMQLTPGRDPLACQIELMLVRLRQNPGDAPLAVELADQLVLLGQPAEADRWYRHAAEVYALSGPEAVPAHVLAGRALALAAIGRREEAEALAVQALKAAPYSIEAQITRSMVAAACGDQDTMERHLQQAGEIAQATLEEVGDDASAWQIKREIAWLFTHYLQRFDDAHRLAQGVLRDHPDDPIAHRVLGAIARERKQWDEAEKLLQPVSHLDTWAAIERARALESAGRKEQADAALRAASRMPANFEQRRVIRELAKNWKVDLPAAQPAAREVTDLLQSFPYEVLDYPLHPARYLSGRIEMSGPDLDPGQPWWCTVRLENVGAFPITIGPAGMIDPELVCLIEARGDRVRSSGSAIRLRVLRRFRLAAGEVLDIHQTIKLGSIRAGMVGTPQMSHEVTVMGVINPVEYQQHGEVLCKSGIGGFRIGPVCFRRRPFVGSSAHMHRLYARCESDDVEARIEATQLLAMLLGEHQHLTAGRLVYSAYSIDVDRVRSVLAARAEDGDWRVRARLAEAMRWFTVDEQTLPAAMRLVNDRHWLVRGLARRMMAEQVGTAFEPVLTRSAEGDPDPWVRRMSKALLGRLSVAGAGTARTSETTASRAGPHSKPADLR